MVRNLAFITSQYFYSTFFDQKCCINGNNACKRKLLIIYKSRFRTYRLQLYSFLTGKAKGNQYFVTWWFLFRPHAKKQITCCNFPILTCNCLNKSHKCRGFLTCIVSWFDEWRLFWAIQDSRECSLIE